jgi:hypothetical protein
MSSSSTLTAVIPARAGAKRSVAARVLRSRAARWISPIAILVIWQLASASGLLSPKTLAAPSDILSTAWDMTVSGDLPDALLVSLRRALLGLLLGTAAAVALGAIAGLSRAGDALVDPPMQMIRTLPLFGLVPLFILWFGIGETSKIALVALGVTIPLYLNLVAALRGSTATSTRSHRRSSSRARSASGTSSSRARYPARSSGSASRSASRGWRSSSPSRSMRARDSGSSSTTPGTSCRPT